VAHPASQPSQWPSGTIACVTYRAAWQTTQRHGCMCGLPRQRAGMASSLARGRPTRLGEAAYIACEAVGGVDERHGRWRLEASVASRRTTMLKADIEDPTRLAADSVANAVAWCRSCHAVQRAMRARFGGPTQRACR
jgi:hypothetical protein